MYFSPAEAPEQSRLEGTLQTEQETHAGLGVESFPVHATARHERAGARSQALHMVGVAIAFMVLAVTAGIGIVVTTYFEKHAHMTMFGYAAVDQVRSCSSLVPTPCLMNLCMVYAGP